MTERADLYLLAADHRRSYEQLLGIEEPIAAQDRERLVALKSLIVAALGDAAGELADTVPGGALGILIDDEYGGPAIDVARRLGLAVALAFERSGQSVLELERADWRQRLADDPPTFAKVLIRHRPDAAPADKAIQLDRLRQLSDACAASPAGFLLELLTPYPPAERAGPIAETIVQMQDAGVAPDVWKVEGVDDVADCAAIVAAARRDGRDGTRVVVLGAGAPLDTVNRWLDAAARGGYDGFAVGRTFWADAVIAHDRGELDAVSARARISARYVSFVDTFRAARSSV